MKKRVVSKPTQKFLSVLLAGVMLLVSIPMTVVGEGLSIGQIGADDNAQLVGTTDTFYEDVSMRDEFSKHYVLESGERYAVIFPEAVHYEEDGEWKEVDNRLTYNSLTGKYVSANPKFTTTFAANASAAELVSISHGEYTVSWGISFAENSGSELMKLSAGASVTNGNDTAERLSAAKAEQASLAKASAETNQAFDTEEAEKVYKNTVTDIGKAASAISYGGSTNSAVSLRYSVSHGKVEEDIILRSKSDFTSYTMTVNTGGLLLTAETDGSVSFKTADGETVFTIDAPWMKDSAYGFSKDIAVTVTQTGNTATITYTPGAEWLNSEDRVYPVLIDPTIITRDYSSNYIDTYVDSTYSSTNCLDYADEQTLMVGVSPVGEFTSFIKILNFPDMNTRYSVEILSAKLHMWSLYDVNYPIEIREITESWESDGFTALDIPSSKYIDEVEAWSNGQYEFDLSSFMTTEIFDKYKDYNYYWENLHHGFMLKSTSTVSDTITTFRSSEAATQRPIMTLVYDYMFSPMFRDGAVYNFKSAASSKYMTVHNGLNATGTNVYQYTENGTASQAFRLEYVETGEYYKIRAMCSSDGSDKVVGFPYANTAYDSNGYSTVNVSLYNNSTGYDIQWLIEPIGTGNLFKIISKADHNLALTVQGLDNGSSTGTYATAIGNINISEYTGEANQHWIIEAGGIELSHMYDISNAEDDENLDVGESVVYNCGADTVGGTVTWSSSNSSVATVYNGLITAQGAGAATITATVKDADGSTVNTYSILVVIELEFGDGIYYIYNFEHTYAILNYSSSKYYAWGGISETRQYMFKVCYIGEGKYSIRSMYDNQYGLTRTAPGVVGHRYMGTSQRCYSSEHPNGVPEASQWYITGNNYDGYVIENVMGGVLTKDQDAELSLESVNGSSLQKWGFIYVGTLGEGTGIEIDNSVSAVVAGETAQLKAHFYSDDMNKNGQDITWSVTNGSGSATILSDSGYLSGVSSGTVTVQVSTSSDCYAQRSIDIIPIKEGKYLFHNSESEMYMQPDDNGASHMEQHTLDGYNDQAWQFIYAGNQYYKIKNVHTEEYLTAPDSTDADEEVIQQSYNSSISARQLWKLTETSDGIYKIQAQSMEALEFVLAVGSEFLQGTPDSAGTNVEQRNDSETTTDEWRLYYFVSSSVECEPQKGEYLCWAATARMFAKHYSNDVSITQRQCVSQIKGEYIDEPGSKNEAANAIYYYLTDIIAPLELPLITSDNHIYSESNVRKFINNGHVIYASFGTYVSGVRSGHARLICGYIHTNEGYLYILRDPGPINEGSSVVLSYSELCIITANSKTTRWDGFIVVQTDYAYEELISS